VWQRDGSTPSYTAGRAAASPKLGGRSDRTLVVVEMGGGNDGLNTVVPINSGQYHDLRPTLGVTDPIALDDSIGLAPQLVKLAARYQAGTVAIVEGVGYDEPNLSHFASLGYWWTGQPGNSAGAGWLGRYLDGTVGLDDPLAGISIGPVPSPALVGDRSFATAWVDTPDDLIAAWKHLAPASPDPATLMGHVQEAIDLTVDARRRLTRALKSDPADAMPADGLPAPQTNRGRYGGSTVSASLALAAQLVASDQQPRVIYVSGLGDYDTHQGLAQRHPTLMSDLDTGIDTFFSTLDAAGAGDRALVMTVSEFGRRPKENGSGTDHGTAAPHFVIGSTVKGGRYGAPPSLDTLDLNGNLEHSTDFRAVYATALQLWLGVEAAAVLGPGFAPIPLLT
jgi:uncharacterized protein (DUF1501 family)